jgi:uncharacterized phage protein gp47/JayE
LRRRSSRSSKSRSRRLLPKAFTRVLAKALSGVWIQIYKYGGFIFLQLFVRYASFRETEILGRKVIPLVEWGRLRGVSDPDAAERAVLDVTVTVKNQTGSLAAGTKLVRSATGIVYTTLASVALNAATVTARVRAVSDPDGNGGAGSIGNLVPGDELSFASPPPNVASTAVVAAQVVTGADAESEASYRARVLEAYQSPPQGGAYADYRKWAKDAAGILNVYPYTGAPGEVDVYVEATVASSGSPDGIPTGAQLTAAANLIQLDVNGLASRRPAGAAVNVLPIVRIAFDLEVTGLEATDVPAAEAAIEAAVDEHLRAREPFIVGLSLLPRNDRITEAGVGGAAQDAASAAGATITSIRLLVSGVPTVAYTLGQGEKAKLGTPSYV